MRITSDTPVNTMDKWSGSHAMLLVVAGSIVLWAAILVAALLAVG